MSYPPILQAEDDENDILLLRYCCKAAGVLNPVHSVTDGQQAIDYLAGVGIFADRDRHPFPCVVLSDIKMPQKNGFDVLRWIRAQPSLRTMVFIMFTSSASEVEIDQAYQLGANSFIIKPAGTDKLTELLRAFQAYWFGCNRFGSTCAFARR